MTNIFFLIFLGASVLCGCFVWLSGKRESLAWALQNHIAFLREQCRDFEQRMLGLEDHVIDYLLSVGAEGTAELSEMKQSLVQVECLCVEASLLLRVKDFDAVHQASRLLDYDYSELEARNPEFRQSDFPKAAWDQRFEHLLQSLGERVNVASIEANTLNLQKRRTRRKSTISGLAAIGIRKVVDQIRKSDLERKAAAQAAEHA